MRCGDCKWWRRPGHLGNANHTEGECRKGSPVWGEMGRDLTYHKWPTTLGDEWCGEFVKLSFRERKRRGYPAPTDHELAMRQTNLR